MLIVYVYVDEFLSQKIAKITSFFGTDWEGFGFCCSSVNKLNYRKSATVMENIV